MGLWQLVRRIAAQEGQRSPCGRLIDSATTPNGASATPMLSPQPATKLEARRKSVSEGAGRPAANARPPGMTPRPSSL